MRSRGFTLIEILIYTSILAVASGLIFGILNSVLRVQNQQSASSEVTSQLNFALQTIGRLVGESSQIDIATSTATSTLKLRMRDAAVNPTCISLASGTITLAQGPSASDASQCTPDATSITNDKVVVNTLQFKKISQYPGHDTVSVDITMAYNTTNPQAQETRSISSAVARVSAATFDSDLVPGADNTYSVGFSPSTRWKDASFSGTVTIGGNVGIGTTAPAAKLSVYAYQSATTTVAIDLYPVTVGGLPAYGIGMGPTGSEGYVVYRAGIGNTSAFGHKWFINGVEMMRIRGDGNVGIGTTSPGASLEVEKSVAGRDEQIIVDNPSSSNGVGVTSGIRWLNGGNQMGIIFDERDNNNFNIQNLQTAPIRFLTGTTFNAGERMRIQNDGNVGIGETAPGSKLSVSGGGSFGAGYDTTASPAGGLIIEGNVGIGTSTPSRLFHVTDGTSQFSVPALTSSAAAGELRSSGTGHATALYLTATAAKGRTWRLASYADGTNNGLFRIRDDTAGADRFAINSSGDVGFGGTMNTYTSLAGATMVALASGNVGIGTKGPTYQLQLSTDSAAKPSTNTWTVASDKRIKKDIRPFKDGLDVVMNINPVLYKYNGKGGFNADGKDHIGVIAQDVQNIAPYTINSYRAKLDPNDKDDTELLNFNSHAITFNLINAVKELKAENDALKARIDAQCRAQKL